MYEVAQFLDTIRKIANDKQVEEDISEILYYHRCHYLLSRIKPDSKMHQKMVIEKKLNRNLVNNRYQACRNIIEGLRENNVSYAVIKGAVLSGSAYGDIYCRRSNDIDLLIDRNSIDTVKKILLTHGFIQGRITREAFEPYTRRELLFQSVMSHQVAPFIKKTGETQLSYVNVDINMDIMWGESKKKADMGIVLKYIEQITICGVTVQKLTPEMEFISLCLHHYKDMNSLYLLATRGLKLCHFSDIYFYLKNNFLNMKLLQELCELLKVTQYVYYCIYYTNHIFEDASLNRMLDLLNQGKNISILATYGLTEDEQYKWDVDFFERLFCIDINEYLKTHLSEKDYQKILLNNIYM